MSNITWILIGADITILGAAISAFFTFKEANNNSRQMNNIESTGNTQLGETRMLRQENETLTDSVQSLQRLSKVQKGKIDTLSSQNLDLAMQLANARKELLGNLTGGDSYCRSFMRIVDANTAEVSFMHVGEYPIYDVQARIVDLSIPFPTVINETNDVFKNDVFINIGNLAPSKEKGISSGVGVFKLNGNFSKELLSFNIFYSTRNGKFVEELRYYRNKQKGWVRAWRVGNSEKKFESHIDDDFPKDKLKW